MSGVEVTRAMYTKMKRERRIKANRIVGIIGFRQHFSSHPNRHSWDLCGHPLYWWVMKCAIETKYIKKILFWTEDKKAQDVARKMSDKFAIINRTVEECREPMWKFVDDLKSFNSRVNHIRPPFEFWANRDEEVKEALGFEPTLYVYFATNQPLVRAESVTRLIEAYFEDDIAENARMVLRDYQEPFFWTPDPAHPEYMIVWGFTGYAGRQARPTTLTPFGPDIITYRGRMHSMAYRTRYIIVGEDEYADIHNEDDLELARVKMKRRIENEQKERETV